MIEVISRVNEQKGNPVCLSPTREVQNMCLDLFYLLKKLCR
jgi:hypothetical protein